MGMSDLHDPSNRNVSAFVRGREQYRDREFLMSYWTKRGDSEISELQEVDLSTGMSRPWVDYT